MPRSIVIHPYAFSSTPALKLVAALDDELEVMYPDWEKLPHPGFQQGFVGGDQADYKANGMPIVSARPQETDQDGPCLLVALDTTDSAIDASMVDDDPRASGAKEQLPTHWTDLKREEISQLHFYIAFDITDTDDSATHPESAHEYTGTPVGCVGIKPMPYFPNHRAQPHLNNTTTDPTAKQLRYAEVKRIYVAPSHRGALVRTSSSADTTRLAATLVQTAEWHARQQLKADRLVLETGCRQIAAIKLYERLGWRKREVYGDYVGAGVEDGGVSICFEFNLSR